MHFFCRNKQSDSQSNKAAWNCYSTESLGGFLGWSFHRRPSFASFFEQPGRKEGRPFCFDDTRPGLWSFSVSHPSIHPFTGAKGAVGFLALTRPDARIGGTVVVRKQPHHALECSSQWRIWCFRFRFPARVLCLPELRAQCYKKRYGNLLTGPVTRGPDRCLDRLLHKCRSLSGRASGYSATYELRRWHGGSCIRAKNLRKRAEPVC